MPTFIDAGDNFNPSARIFEDNWVEQLIDQGNRVVFMGDDTWTALYPEHFHRNYSYPSFNVKDLHTVDNGVLDHLVPEMSSRDWDVIIAHFLGVDHVGHRYGPSHPAMIDKLQQMNAMLESVIATMDKNKREHPDEETILLVMGDHGMTSDGNHGGASELEVSAALFMLATDLINNQDVKVSNTDSHSTPFIEVSQIDIVPSIALMLGAPIPHGNLGQIIPELFLRRDHRTILEHVTSAEQFVEYLQSLQSQQQEVLLRALEELNLAQHINDWQLHEYLMAYNNQTRQFPRDGINELLQKFQRANQLFENFISTDVKSDVTWSSERIKLAWHVISAYRTYHKSALDMCRRLWTTFDVDTMTLGVAVMVGSCLALALQLVNGLHTFPYLATFMALLTGALVALLRHVSLGTVTFFVTNYSDYLLYGSLASIAAHLLFQIWQLFRAGLRHIQFDVMTLATLVLLVLRIVALFTNSYIEAEYRVVQFLQLSMIALYFWMIQRTEGPWSRAALLAVVIKLGSFTTRVKQEEHDEDLSTTYVTLLTTVFVPLIALLVLHRVVMSLTLRASYAPTRSSRVYQVLLYLMTALVAGYWTVLKLGALEANWAVRILFPNAVYLLSLTQIALLVLFAPFAINLRTHVLALTASLTPPLLLLLGPTSAWVLLVLSLQLVLAPPATHRPFFAVLFLSLTAVNYFYATGHYPDFNSLQFWAPFVGYDEYHPRIGAILTVLNTWAAPLLVTAALSSINHTVVDSHRSSSALATVFDSHASFVLIQALVACSTMIFNHLQRRHLMVWRIFAPKYIFEALVLLFIDGLVLVFVLFLIRWSQVKKPKEKQKDQ
jgi:phosphatidylinositol glycan class O